MNDKKKKQIVLTVALVVVVVAAAAIAALFAVHKKTALKEYAKQMDVGDKYYDDSDYESAIVAYQAAIDANPGKEDGYVKLANTYLASNDMSKAKMVLRQGIARIKKTDMLSKMLDSLTTEAVVSNLTERQIADASVGVTLDFNFMSELKSYSYAKYNGKYGNGTLNADTDAGDTITVAYSGINAVFTYGGGDNGAESINAKKHCPLDTALPTKVVFTNLSQLFKGFGDCVSKDRLQAIFEKQAETKYDTDLISNADIFKMSGYTFAVACDENGNVVSADAANYMTFDRDTENAGKNTVSGSVIDAATGKGVKADLYVDSSSSSADEQHIMTDTKGAYELKLDAGKYTVTVKASGYMEEKFDLVVDDGKDQTDKNFMITTEIGQGEIRIVLTWGESPFDLDSHLRFGDRDEVSWMNKVLKDSSGNKIAELDVDDMSSYGPETITLYQSNKDCKYYVQDYTGSKGIGRSGATVKVYQGSKEPVTYTAPAGSSADKWNVFEIKNGVIKDINTVE